MHLHVVGNVLVRCEILLTDVAPVVAFVRMHSQMVNELALVLHLFAAHRTSPFVAGMEVKVNFQIFVVRVRFRTVEALTDSASTNKS